MPEPDSVQLIHAVADLITVITGLITVIGGTYIAIRQHRLFRQNEVSRTAQIDDVKKEIKDRAAELKETVINGAHT